MTEERRKYIRLDTNLEFSYKTRGSKSGPSKSVTKNISRGGIRGAVDKRIKKGDWLEFNIYAPAYKVPISGVGKVIWTADEKAGKIDAGIKFEEIDAEMKNKFLEYMCEQLFSELERLTVQYGNL